MVDIWDKKKRSEVMSKIRPKDTKPEILVRKALFAKGFRYRKNYNKLPGKPDIVLPKYKTVIFVHGCFWHGHEKKDCIDSHIPKSNIDFWTKKIARNKERDKENINKLNSDGWRVITIWDCEIKGKKEIEVVIQSIINILQQPFNE